MDVFEKIKELLGFIESTEINDEASLESFRLQYIGSKNVIKDLFGEIKNVPNDRKKEFGQAVNDLKNKAEEKYEVAKTYLEERKDANFKIDIDLTAPVEDLQTGSRHPITIVMNKLTGIFARLGFTVAEEREVETDWFNFTAMNTPEDHPARDMQDTFYLKDSTVNLLRTHTSSVQSRVMMTTKPPIRIIAPGRVYRNETVSARSHCQFHQVEGLYIDKNVSFADMKQTLLFFAREMFGQQTEIRLRPSFFPFTEPSAEMDVWLGLETETARRLTKGTGWLEVLGCGMVDPKVLENCGIDSEVYTGYAFGIGIERSAMQMYDINDIRLLFENDIRFIRQFAPIV
jgi:phenylalanyl-tRNA synthetase alpha chain